MSSFAAISSASRTARGTWRSVLGRDENYGVLFDSAGKVIGGGSTHPQNEVPPGKRIDFAIFVPGAQLAQAASAQVSVEPEFAG